MSERGSVSHPCRLRILRILRKVAEAGWDVRVAGCQRVDRKFDWNDGRFQGYLEEDCSSQLADQHYPQQGNNQKA